MLGGPVSRNPLSRQSANDPSVTALLRNLCAQPDATPTKRKKGAFWGETESGDTGSVQDAIPERATFEVAFALHMSVYLSLISENSRPAGWSPLAMSSSAAT